MTSLASLISWGALLLVAFGALAFGGVEGWSSAVLNLGAAVLFALLLWSKARAGSLRFPSLASPLGVCLGLFFLLVLFQLLPLPPALNDLFHSASAPAGGNEGAGSWRPLSSRPAATLAELMRLIACLAVFLAVAEADDAESLSVFTRMILVLTAFGFVLSLFGIIQKFSWSGKLYWIRKVSDPRAHPFGPFVNRNHFAGFIAMVIPLSLSLFLSDRLHKGPRRRSPSGFDPVQALMVFMILIMALALFLTVSRGGILSFLLSLGLFALLCRRLRLARTRAIVQALLVLLLFFLTAFTYFGWDQLLERLHPTGKAPPHRLRVWSDSIEIVRDYPLLGTGLNTFAFVYNPEGHGIGRYKSFSTRYDYPFAENDYLQLAVETGMIGLLIVLAALLSFYLPLRSLHPDFLPGRKSSRRPPTLLPGPLSRRFLLVGGYASATALIVHSFMDFNFHIPANAFLFALVVGMTSRTARDLGMKAGEGERPHSPVPVRKGERVRVSRCMKSN
jgi:O-antigen ligase